MHPPGRPENSALSGRACRSGQVAQDFSPLRFEERNANFQRGLNQVGQPASNLLHDTLFDLICGKRVVFFQVFDSPRGQ